MIDQTQLESFLSASQELRIMVIGDLMLDRYLWGNVNRISPEAPVPIVDVYNEENRLGGAANVALNLHSLGAIPILSGFVGEDMEGTSILSLVEKKKWDTAPVMQTDQRRTTVKIRILGNHQQILRIDKEDRKWIGDAQASRMLDRLLEQMASCHAIVIQDYDKGMLTPFFIKNLKAEAKACQVPLLVDPKFRQFWDYSGCTVFKPNLKELSQGLGIRLSADRPAEVIAAIQQLRERMPHKHTLVTLGANGMIWVSPDGASHSVPAYAREVADVSGAGDTVIAMAALGIAQGLPPSEIAALANLAGGLVCESLGVVPITQEQLLGPGEG